LPPFVGVLPYGVAVIKDEGALPRVLVDPPWLRAPDESGPAEHAPVVLAGLTPPPDRRFVWAPGEREAWANVRVHLTPNEGRWKDAVKDYVAGKLTYPPSQAAMFACAPEGLVHPLLPGWHPDVTWDFAHSLQPIVARFAMDVRDNVLPLAKRNPYGTGEALLPFLDADVARMMADWLYRLKSAQDVTRRWFGRHGAAAVARRNAETALRLIASAAGRDTVADRLVPGFGLETDGGLVLDYGPRRFTVAFDEQLKPYVTDEDGKRRKDLPKPGAKDDPELAPAARQRFAALRKDVRTVASDQLRRLESAMVSGRRWTPAEFGDFFTGHPLMWHIARRLVWVSEDDAGRTAFRIAEDRTLADAEDDTFALPENARVGIAHPVLLGDAVKAWSELFADYEITQPFPQLGRPVHALTDRERAGGRLARFEGATVPIGAVLGLTRYGWERCGDGRRFGELDAVTASEVLADLTRLTASAP